MKILCITDEYPWPATSGYRIRLAHVVEALGAVGELDVFCTVSDRRDLTVGALPPPAGVRRLFVHHHASYTADARGARRWLSSREPRAIAWVDWRDAAAQLGAWMEGPYDTVWFSHAHPWVVLGAAALGRRIVVDLDNLEDEKLEALLALGRDSRARPVRGAARGLLAGVFDRADVRRWRRIQQRAAAVADAVVVCSEDDRRRLGAANAVVVPNGFDPQSPGGGEAPVLTMVGLMIYPPNADGARFFAERVLPLVQKAVPDARFRVVGRHDGTLDGLRALPGVQVDGEVANLDDVFASTRAVVVPLRAGSGTRLKVLEGFARRLPVVATPLGYEGIAARDGVEILVGRSPDELAAACVRVLTDERTAAAVAGAGYELWRRSYQWSEIERSIAAVAQA